jgi:hypothetical protein
MGTVTVTDNVSVTGNQAVTPNAISGPGAGTTAHEFARFADTTGALLEGGITLDTDTALAANSDTKLASQKAVKSYVDAASGANDAMIFKGVIDCSANPNYPAADRGWTYRVSVAGKIGGASGINVENGDLLTCMTDSTASGNQATVGAQWAISQANIDGAVTGPAASVSGNLASFNGTGGKTIQDSGISVDTDGTLAANSANRVPSQSAVVTALALKAPLASPAFTGNPTVPTQSTATNNTRAASTAYADTSSSNAASGAVTTAGVNANLYTDAAVAFNYGRLRAFLTGNHI